MPASTNTIAMTIRIMRRLPLPLPFEPGLVAGCRSLSLELDRFLIAHRGFAGSGMRCGRCVWEGRNVVGVAVGRSGEAVAAAERLDQRDVGRQIACACSAVAASRCWITSASAAITARSSPMPRCERAAAVSCSDSLAATCVARSRRRAAICCAVSACVATSCAAETTVLSYCAAAASSSAFDAPKRASMPAAFEDRQMHRRRDVEDAAAGREDLAHVDRRKPGERADADVRIELGARLVGVTQRGFDAPAARGDVGPAREEIDARVFWQRAFDLGQRLRRQRRHIGRRRRRAAPRARPA